MMSTEFWKKIIGEFNDAEAIEMTRDFWDEEIANTGAGETGLVEKITAANNTRKALFTTNIKRYELNVVEDLKQKCREWDSLYYKDYPSHEIFLNRLFERFDAYVESKYKEEDE